jgi:hypothetical protein
MAQTGATLFNAVFTIKAPDTAAQPATKPPTKAAAATASITGS